MIISRRRAEIDETEEKLEEKLEEKTPSPRVKSTLTEDEHLIELVDFNGEICYDEDKMAEAIGHVYHQEDLDTDEYVNSQIEEDLKENFYFDDGTKLEGRFYVKILRKIVEIKPSVNAYMLNDIGMAELLASVYKEDLFYCIERRAWYYFHKRIWKIDIDNLEVERRLNMLIQLYGLYVKKIMGGEMPPEEIEEIMKYLSKIADYNAMIKIIKTARSYMPKSVQDLDSHKNLLLCENGIYDLTKESFTMEVPPSKLITLSTKAMYQRQYIMGEPCYRWYEFIDEIMDSNKEKARFLQKALGYSLFGESKEECFFIAYGKTSRNGKGTLFNTIFQVLGDYAQAISPTFICETNQGVSYNAPAPMLADLVGVRYLTMSEPKDGVKLDESNIKQYTGRDPIKARKLYSSPFIFIPQFTMWLSCNKLPIVQDNSLFKSKRVHVIEFDRHFDNASQDKNLKELFLERNARSTVLTWLIDGYNMYKKEGLAVPDVVINATKQYELFSDKVGIFLDDCCVDNNVAKTERKVLYSTYKKWCSDNGYRPLGSINFYGAIESRYEKVKIKGIYYFDKLEIIGKIALTID